MSPLRVCDFGRVSARRSQTLWHAIAEGVSAGSPPTLSFMRPSRPYVGIGYHRPAHEVDLAWCRTARLPVYRRMAGGGAVYLDSGQLFFQICLPARQVPAAREVALRTLLAPAVTAFRASAVDARLDDSGEITVGDAKVCGHAAAQIGEAVVVVGNLIQSFDHLAASRVLALPDGARAEVERLMRRYVAATPADAAVFREAAVAAYAAALDLDPAPVADLSDGERAALGRLDRIFSTGAWRWGPVGDRAASPVRVVKVRAGVSVVSVGCDGATLVVTVIGGRVERARLQAPGVGRAVRAGVGGLVGLPLSEAGDRLAAAGGVGGRLARDLGRVRLVA